MISAATRRQPLGTRRRHWWNCGRPWHIELKRIVSSALTLLFALLRLSVPRPPTSSGAAPGRTATSRASTLGAPRTVRSLTAPPAHNSATWTYPTETRLRGWAAHVRLRARDSSTVNRVLVADQVARG